MKRTLFIALLALASSNVYAGDASAGAQKAKPCTACHGANFDTPIFMAHGTHDDMIFLARLHYKKGLDYLARALTDYKSGARKNPVMGGQAAALSAQDIDNIATYISGLSGKLKTIPLQRFVH